MVPMITPTEREMMLRVLDLLVEAGCLSAYEAHSDGSALVCMDDEDMCRIIHRLVSASSASPKIREVVLAAVDASGQSVTGEKADLLRRFTASIHQIYGPETVSNPPSNP